MGQDGRAFTGGWYRVQRRSQGSTPASCSCLSSPPPLPPPAAPLGGSLALVTPWLHPGHARPAPAPAAPQFKGLWRVQFGLAGPGSAWLSYALRVRPRAWVPAALVQGQLSEQVAANLAVVRAHLEAQHAARRARPAA